MLSLQKRKLFKILEISSIFVGVIMTLYYFYPVFASPPSSAYAPGETTDPSCSPGDTNCTVHSPLTTTLTTSTAIIMGTSSLRFAYDATNFTALTVGTDGALTVSSTNGVTTTFVNKISFLSGVTITNATSTNFHVSGILTAGTFSPTNLSVTSVTSTNLFSSNASTTNATTTNLNVSSLANILQLGINSSSPIASLAVQGTAGTNLFSINSSTGTTLLTVLTNGQLLADIGSGGVPGYAFVGDSNTGMYGSGAGVLAFSVDGGTRVRIADAGTEITGGTEASPGWKIFDDADTGIFGDTANLIGIVAGGVGRILVKTTSTLFNPTNVAGYQLGINTSTPFASLAIQGAGSSNPFSIVSSTAGAESMFTVLTNGRVGINSSSPIASLAIQGTAGSNPFSINSSTGAPLLTIVQDGRIGMGTAAPAAGTFLHILGSALLPSPLLRLESSGGTVGSIQIINGGRMVLEATNDMILQEAGGKVGIGTSTPIARLAVTGAGTENPFTILSSTNASLLTVLTNGNVGIGSTASVASVKLQILSANNINTNDIMFTNDSGGSYRSGISNSQSLVPAAMVFNVSDGTATGQTRVMTLRGDGTVGIGTSTPAERLSVVGNISNIMDPTTVISQVTTTSVGTSPNDIFVYGRYAYTANGNDTLSVIDISDPTAPKQLATAAIGDNPNSIFVSGRYAYTANVNSRDVSVVDISNPLFPRQVATVAVGSGPQGIYVSGHYAYVSNRASSTISVVDISNPATPVQIATTSVGTNPNDIFVSGRYAYTPNGGGTLSVIDISNPAAPVLASTTAVGSSPNSVYVSGRYAYTANFNSDNISIVDISNPSAPIQTSTVTVGDGPIGIFVSGRYAYVVNQNSDNISVVDVSKPKTPIQITTTSVGNAPIDIYVSGRYAYVANVTDNNISVVDISGTEVTSLIAHSAEVGNIQSRNDIIASGNIMAGTSLFVGAGGIRSDGALSVFASSTGATSSIFDVSSIQTADIFKVLANGTVGIGTSTPIARLTIQGSGAENPFSIVTSTADATSMLTVLTNGNVGINSSSPIASLAVQGTGGSNPFSINSSTGASLLSILQNGKVGIGKSTPIFFVDIDAGAVGDAFGIKTTSGSAGDIAFLLDTGGTDVTIRATGNIGLNTSTPNAHLAIQGKGSANPLSINSSTGAVLLGILTNGNVGVNSSTPMNQFSVQGKVSMLGLDVSAAGNGVCVTATGTITDAGAAGCSGSSIRYKENIRPFTGSGLDIISKLNIVLGNYKPGMAGAHVSDSVKDEKDRFFLIAEEVALVDPRLVDFNAQDLPETLNFDEFNALYARGLQELNEKLTGKTSEQDKTEIYSIDPGCDAKGNCPQVGDVVCSFEGASSTFFIEQCSATSTDSIVGVVSDNYSTSSRSVVLGGRAPVNVSSANGSIKLGDYLTSSAIPGVAVKSLEPGKVIGMALQSFDGSASPTGSIKISVNTSWSFGSLLAESISNEMPDFSSVVLDKFTLAIKNSLRKLGLLIKNGIATVKEVFADKVTTKQLCVGNTCVNESQLQEILNKTQTQAAAPATAIPAAVEESLSPTTPPDSNASSTPPTDSSSASSTPVTDSPAASTDTTASTTPTAPPEETPSSTPPAAPDQSADPAASTP